MTGFFSHYRQEDIAEVNWKGEVAMVCPYCNAFNVEGVTLCQHCGVTLKTLAEPLSLLGSSIISVGLNDDRREERKEKYREYHRDYPDTN